jgi:hypothetical protein
MFREDVSDSAERDKRKPLRRTFPIPVKQVYGDRRNAHRRFRGVDTTRVFAEATIDAGKHHFLTLGGTLGASGVLSD